MKTTSMNNRTLKSERSFIYEAWSKLKPKPRHAALVVGLTLGVVAIMWNLTPSLKFSEQTQDRIAASSQYEHDRFQTIELSTASGVSSAREYFLAADRKQRTPQRPLPGTKVDLAYFTQPGERQLNATWLGHSSLMINIGGYRIVTDPVFENKITPVGPSRFNGDLPVDTDALPPVDLVVISHDHYDHLNKSSIQQLAPKTATFAVPLGVAARLQGWGVAAEKIVELDWWEAHQHSERLRLVATPAQHFSGRGLTDRNKTLWASWVIMTDQHRIFFSGDSGYFDGFKQIGDSYGPFDATFIECGAYNEAWCTVHMFPEETIQAHLDLRGKVLHPIHWGTFNLAMHAWDEPMRRLYQAARAHGVQTTTPIVGETSVYPDRLHDSKWWQDVKTQPSSAALPTESRQACTLQACR